MKYVNLIILLTFLQNCKHFLSSLQMPFYLPHIFVKFSAICSTLHLFQEFVRLLFTFILAVSSRCLAAADSAYNLRLCKFFELRAHVLPTLGPSGITFCPPPRPLATAPNLVDCRAFY